MYALNTTPRCRPEKRVRAKFINIHMFCEAGRTVNIMQKSAKSLELKSASAHASRLSQYMVTQNNLRARELI